MHHRSTTRKEGHHHHQEEPGSDAPEKVLARAWLEAHAHDPEVAGASLPDDHYRDPDTGETVGYEQSAWLTAGHRRHGREQLRSTEGHRGVLSYSHLKTELDPSRRYRAIIGRGQRNRDEMDVRVRLDRAMATLREDQQALLRMRYFEQLTLEDIAEELRTRKQSVHDKLQVAQQDLVRALAGWNLPVDLASELFGNRTREGRPSRDREGERLAAELAIVGYFASRQEADDD